MARSRSIRRSHARTTRSGARSLLPEGLQSFVARRLYDLYAASLFAAGGFVILSLASYNPADPSWNAAQDGAVSNLGDAPGAFIADLLFQTIGIAGFLIGAALMVYGVRCFRREILSPVWLRGTALIFSCVLVAVGSAAISSHGFLAQPKLGGSIGMLMLQSLSTMGQKFSPLLGAGFFAGVSGIIGSILFAYASVLNRDEIIFALEKIRNFIGFITTSIVALAHNFTGWVLHYNDPDYKPAKNQRRTPTVRRQPEFKIIDDEIDSDDDEEPEELAAPARPSSKIPVSLATTKKKKITQQNLSLQDGTQNGDWILPPLSLLQNPKIDENLQPLSEDGLRRNAELLRNVLADFNVEGEIVSISPGPVVTLYELEPAPGTKSSRVISLSDDIARSMSAISVRSAVVPGRNVIGIELPNKHRQTVYMQELLNSPTMDKSPAALPLVLGKDIAGDPIIADLSKMPHLLIAGTTGSGKSVAVNTMILSLLFRLPPEKCRFIMIDPKMLELSVYDDIPHLLSPVVTEPGKAIVALKWAVKEMENRYRAMSKLGVRNIEGYNDRLREARKKGEVIMRKVQTGFDPATGKPEYEDQPLDLTDIPFIVIVVDEFADLMLVAGKDVESAIQRLAQMARAAGIHLIMATQRPSVDVITGVIKANFPTRISFQVTSKIDSRTILGEGGAEQLLGRGDMLYMAPGGRITRVHGPFVSDAEVEGVVAYLKKQGTPVYINDVTDGDDDFEGNEVLNAMFGGGEGSGNGVDELYDQAVAVVAREGKASTSFVQRYLQIGYNRAARIVEEMEKQGVISPANAVGKREVLIRDFSEG
jgi:S-DNA-T family DNA segregation ATPase FtsK/SpoIIIE